MLSAAMVRQNGRDCLEPFISRQFIEDVTIGWFNNRSYLLR